MPGLPGLPSNLDSSSLLSTLMIRNRNSHARDMELDKVTDTGITHVGTITWTAAVVRFLSVSASDEKVTQSFC